MAKKKNQEAVEETAPVLEPVEETIQAPIEAPEAPEAPAEEIVPEAPETPEATPEKETEAPAEEVVDTEEIPEAMLPILKRHPELKAMYIDKKGGIFTEDTPKCFVKDAVLYQNPYFNQ